MFYAYLEIVFIVRDEINAAAKFFQFHCSNFTVMISSIAPTEYVYLLVVAQPSTAMLMDSKRQIILPRCYLSACHAAASDWCGG